MLTHLIIPLLIVIVGSTIVSINRAEEPTLPTIVSHTPAMNALNIPANASIVITFSKEMNAATLDRHHMKAVNTKDNDEFEGNITYDPATRTMTFMVCSFGQAQGSFVGWLGRLVGWTGRAGLYHRSRFAENEIWIYNEVRTGRGEEEADR